MPRSDEENVMETAEERTFQEKLEGLPDPITSDDLSGLDPRTAKEYLMVLLPMQIGMLKRLERVNDFK